MKLPPDDEFVIAWEVGTREPVMAVYRERGELGADVEWWDGCEIDEETGEMFAPPGWFVRSHDVIDGGEHGSYWLGDPDVIAAWAPIPARPSRGGHER